MGSTSDRGRLTDRVPSDGEEFHDLAHVGGARVQHIVSSASPDHGEQVQSWDEWVLVVSGGARLELGGDLIALAPMQWVVIPAGTVHRVVATERGTHWIAVHGPAPARPGEESADVGQP
jgi:cupin 2 domain-containing protein